ncbi:CoA-binding protein [Planctopirus hydrillae]|uniref:CoA-binding protein n=1 Tax=Planctopirus hydrillae TaxID=1841610 RepID=A0A1C3E8P6_9PLAN|nr:CoA-binding protein [Planctopirus hydrillae]ODA29625.1 CoA-binding protein [Planctopirus hydrillae]
MTNPQPTVAIIGASADRTKYGNKSLRAHLAQGFQVFPVNPKGGEIEGLKVYSKLSELPGPVDRVSMYVPPVVGLSMIDEIARLKPQELWLNPGSESDELYEKATALGLNVIIACSIIDIGTTPTAFGDA